MTSGAGYTAATVGDPDWVIDALTACGNATAMLAWIKYTQIGAMHQQLTVRGTPVGNKTGTRMRDIEAQTAARIAMAKGITQRTAETWLAEAIAMRDRLPAVGLQLRAGIISPRQFRLIVNRTDLIDDQNWASALDAAIAATLRLRRGTWSNRRLADLVDRLIFRHDPDAVRRRHEKAKENRSVWMLPDKDGMTTLGASLAAQNAQVAYSAISRLASSVCEHDPRPTDARRSDALFALLTGLAFEGDCGHDDCTATIPDPTELAVWVRDQQDHAIGGGAVIVHAIAEQSTVNGENDNPAYLDGHGVISAAHLRDLLSQPETRIRPLVPDASDSSLPTYQPADPYRPSSALDTFIRIRDGYCTTPGCDQPAWNCDLDHITEYDHDDPAAGGQTHPDGLGAKCRPHHGLKTEDYGWLDDQYRDATGRLVSETISPEGIRFPGPAETNTDLFPSLNSVTWHNPPTPATSSTDNSGVWSRHRRIRNRNRTKAKHARRQRERQANREHRLAEQARAAKREEQRRKEHPRETDGDPPY